uniref:NADH-ubiquinone oxidoreductase chain 4L n=1 Tax=Anilany helenae TaxID=508491 RepID=A0A8K1JBV1_9NEOB|nr:NADH dehydrogenase subunit 4L [Anilany helenae]
MAYLFIFTFFTTMAGLAFHRTHLLSALLCLEGMMLTIFLALALWPTNLSYSMLMTPLIVLTISACEAAIGLSLMIASARSHGCDHLKTLNLLQC